MTQIADVTSTADGWFKDVFGKITDARPDGVRLLDYLKFEEENKLGQQLSEVVWLTDEHGFTYQTGTGTGANLNASIVAESDELVGTAGQIVLRSQTSYKTFSSAVAAGKQAFGSYYKQKVANMRRAHIKRLEVNAMHGGRSIGTVESQSGAGTTRAYVITAASWAPWIWCGSKGLPLDGYLVSGGTKRNSNATVFVTSVTFSTRTVNVSGNATDLDAIVAGDEFFYLGSYGEEATGLIGAVSNSGTYLGIAASTYELWAGNTVAVGSVNFTWDKLQDGIEEACSKGLEEDIVAMVSLPSWSNLNSDVSALRKIDAGYSKTKTEIGTEKLVYHSQNGMVEIVASGFCKGGEAFFFPRSSVGRFGSTDLTFELPGVSGEGGSARFFKFVDGVMAVECQSYSDTAAICRAPAKGCLFTGIVN